MLRFLFLSSLTALFLLSCSKAEKGEKVQSPRMGELRSVKTNPF